MISQALEHGTDKQIKDTILPNYAQKFAKIFEKEASERFPPSRVYDHAIELKPGFTPKDCPIYSLTPKENEALDEFIKENLRKGYIRPSNSPQASPIFFVPKKDPNDLRPCEDYRYINEWTIKSAYPLPRQEELSPATQRLNQEFLAKLAEYQDEIDENHCRPGLQSMWSAFQTVAKYSHLSQ